MLIGMQSLFPALIGDTGSGDGEAGGSGEGSGAGGQPQGQQQDGGTGAGAGDGWTPPASQAELDKLFADRAKRAAEAETRKLLEATGAKSLEELITARVRKPRTARLTIRKASGTSSGRSWPSSTPAWSTARSAWPTAASCARASAASSGSRAASWKTTRNHRRRVRIVRAAGRALLCGP